MSIRVRSSIATAPRNREQGLVSAFESSYDRPRSTEKSALSVRSSARVDFLTPQFFDVLVIATIVSGLFLAAARLRRDFRQPPRFPEDEPPKE